MQEEHDSVWLATTQVQIELHGSPQDMRKTQVVSKAEEEQKEQEEQEEEEEEETKQEKKKKMKTNIHFLSTVIEGDATCIRSSYPPPPLLQPLPPSIPLAPYPSRLLSPPLITPLK